MTFLFVDRITEIEPGKNACGEFSIPAGLPYVPGWLVAEAVGQLAAWAAMARLGFRARPVAALAGEVSLTGVGRGGSLLSLSAQLNRCDDGVVSYSGIADLDGSQIGGLRRCVGPMLAMEEFDDAKSVERRFALLCDGGTRGHARAASLPIGLPLTVTGGRSGITCIAQLEVPEKADFFADHFPRRPVFPATLLIDAQSRVASQLAAEALGVADSAGVTVRRVRNVKVRAFTSPGQVLEITAEVRNSRPDALDIGVVAEAQGKRVATASVEVGRPV